MWGSDFPSSPEGGYIGQVQLGQTALPWLSDDDRNWIMGETAHKLWPMLQAPATRYNARHRRREGTSVPVHAFHEAQFATPDAFDRSLTATGAEVIEKLERMEASGIDNVAISVTDAQGARDLIQDFGREVIAKRA